MTARRFVAYWATRPNWIRLLAGTIVAPILSTMLAGLFTIDSFGVWWNAFAGLFGFLLATWVTSIVAGKYVAISVGVGMGATWGVAALTVLISRWPTKGLELPSLWVLGSVAAAIVFAYYLGGRIQRRDARMGQSQ